MVLASEVENGNFAVGRSTGEDESNLAWGPGDGVDGELVVGEWAPLLLPLVLLLFLPDLHCPIVRARGEDVPELRVSPLNLPHWPLMPADFAVLKKEFS